MSLRSTGTLWPFNHTSNYDISLENDNSCPYKFRLTVFISGRSHRQLFLPVSTSEILKLFTIKGSDMGRKKMHDDAKMKNTSHLPLRPIHTEHQWQRQHQR